MTWKCRQNVGVKNESPQFTRALELFFLFIFHADIVASTLYSSTHYIYYTICSIIIHSIVFYR